LVDQLEVVEGMRFDRGFVSPYFINTKNQRVELESCRVLLYDGKVSNAQTLLPIMETCVQANQPLLVIAEDIEGEALTVLVINKMKGVLKCSAVKAPGFGDNRKASLQDLAVVTGGTVISEDMGQKLEGVTIDQLGVAKRVVVSKDDTVVMDGGGSKTEIEERCNLIRSEMKMPGVSTYDIEKLSERLAKLSGGVAVIKVGGSSEVEVGEKKDRIDDALNATRAAVDDGIVAGGGMALLYSSLVLKDLKYDNHDQKVGIEIVRKALAVPARTILENAGLDGAMLVGKLLEEAKGDSGCTRGIDAQTGLHTDMIKAGIIDPTKVVRTALMDASGVASLMTTTEAIIVDMPKKDGGGPPVGMGGGGGMGGMF